MVAVIPQHSVEDGYLDRARLDAVGVVLDAAGLLAFVDGHVHPARTWTAPPGAR